MDKYLFSEDIHCGVTQILIVAGGGERADLELVARMNGDTAYKCRVWMAAPIQFVMDLLKYWSGDTGSLGTKDNNTLKPRLSTLNISTGDHVYICNGCLLVAAQTSVIPSNISRMNLDLEKYLNIYSISPFQHL